DRRRGVRWEPQRAGGVAGGFQQAERGELADQFGMQPGPVGDRLQREPRGDAEPWLGFASRAYGAAARAADWSQWVAAGGVEPGRPTLRLGTGAHPRLLTGHARPGPRPWSRRPPRPRSRAGQVLRLPPR